MTKVVVPQDKCPLDVLAEMGERTTKAWIYFHANAVQKLVKTFTSMSASGGVTYMKWEKTNEYPETELHLKSGYSHWYFCKKIVAKDIAFNLPVNEPEEIIFIKMEL